MLKKNKPPIIIFMTVCVLAICIVGSLFVQAEETDQGDSGQKYIKWVKFNIPLEAMEKALKADIENHDAEIKTPFVSLLALLGAKYWGEWDRYKPSDMDDLISKLKSGESETDISKNYEKYPYFEKVYGAIFSQMIGKFSIAKENDSNGRPILEEKYGLKSYSPIAYGYKFSHCRDFGNSRNFGYRRNHLGNDLMARSGTPIVAVESGIIAKCAWNKYGEPIGYVGMTGYSENENVNGMQRPHLHFGIQLIFHPSQEEGNNEIWIDVYDIVNFLEHHKSVLTKDPKDKDFRQKYLFEDPTYRKFVKS